MRKRKLISLLVVMSLLFQIISVPLAYATALEEGAAQQQTGSESVLQEDENGGEQAPPEEGGDGEEAPPKEDGDGEETPPEEEGEDEENGGLQSGSVEPPFFTFGSGGPETVIPENLTDTNYLVIHGTTGEYTDLGGPSSITITPVGGGALTGRVEGNQVFFDDVPDGAEVNMKIVFHLDDGEDEEDGPYQYTQNNFFYIDLPEGIAFNSSADETNPEEIRMNGALLATWFIDSTGDDCKIKVKLTEGVVGKFGIWGEIDLVGSFSEYDGGDGGQTSITLGAQQVIFNRKQPEEGTPSVVKSGEYSAEDNAITWTVTVKAPEGESAFDFSGYTIVDEYSDNQEYKSGTFNVGMEPIADAYLDLETNSQVSYTFPEETEAEAITITYQTTPTTFGAEDDKNSSVFDNEAILKNRSNTTVDSDDHSLTLDWIEKTGNRVSDTYVIKWEVEVNVPGSGSVTGAEIVDEFPAGLALIANESYPVQLIMGGETVTVESGEGSGAYTYDEARNKLIYRFPADGGLSGSAKLVYYTEMTNIDGDLDDNEAVSFINDVSFIWEQMPPDSFPPSDQATAGIVGGGGIVSKSAESTRNYTHGDPSLIKWTIDVNRNNVSITNAGIADTIPAGQELYITAEKPFTVTGGAGPVSITSPASSGGFTYSSANSFAYAFGDITSAYTVEYYTKITDFSSLYINTGGAISPVEFGNSVVLSRSGERVDNASGTQRFNSQVLEKSRVGEYNYSDRTVQWKIVVNRNQLPMTNAVVTDAIPAGMEIYVAEGKTFNITNDTDSAVSDIVFTSLDDISDTSTPLATTANGFSYSFGDIDDQYTITFYTRLTDAGLAEQWADNKVFTNEAEIKSTEIPAGIRSSANVNVKNPVITKETVGAVPQADATIDWKVVINPAKVALSNAAVIDQLHENLTLFEDTVKLYEATVSSTDIVSKGDVIAWSSDGSTKPNFNLSSDNTLTVNLPDGPYAYILEFTTLMEDNITGWCNTATLSMDDSPEWGGASSATINVSNLWSRGGAGSASLTVKKMDESGNALNGAKFRLLNKNGISITGGNMQAISGEGGEDGIAKFTGIPNWAYYVQEYDPPAGYLLNAPVPVRLPDGEAKRPSEIELDEEGIAYTFANARGYSDIEFQKTGKDGSLSGAVFSLEAVEGTSLDGKDFTARTATSSLADGKVSFADVPMGTYKLKEVSTLEGYLLSTDEYEIVIGYNSDKTGTAVTWQLNGQAFNAKPGATLREISNEVALAKVEISKTGAEGVSLDGGKFTLSGTSVFGEAVTITGVASVGGKVTFEDVPLGTYEISETEAPEDYLLSSKIIEVKVSYEDEEAQSGTMVEYRFEGEVDYLSAITLNNLLIPHLKLIKYGDGQPLKDAGFALYKDNAQVGQAVLSDEHGEVEFADVQPGTYTIKEVSTPDGYLLSQQVIQVEVGYNEDESATVVTYKFADSQDAPSTEPLTVDNIPGIADVSFNKIGIGPGLDESGVSLLGGSFRLKGTSTLYGDWGMDDESLIIESPDASGVVTFADIPMGTYTIEEIDPPAGYLFSDRTISVSVVYNDEKTETKVLYKLSDEDGEASEEVRAFENERGVGAIEFTKTGWDGQPLDGGTFTLTAVSVDDGTVFDAMTAVAEGGVVKFENIPMGVYTITETEAPDGYLKPDDYLEGQDAPNSAIEVQIVYADDTRTSTKVEYRWLGGEAEFSGEQLTVENWLIPSIELLKVNESGRPLYRALFALYKDGKEVQRIYSDRDGIVLFERVMPGDYIIKEIMSPAGYDRYPYDIPVTVTPGPEVDVIKPQLYEIVNTRTELGAIRIMKIGSDTGRVLEGATFGLYDTDGRLLSTSMTGPDGIAEFRELHPGRYIVKEITAPVGYIGDETAYEIMVSWRTVHDITVENEPIPRVPAPSPPSGPTVRTIPQAGELWDATFISILGGALILGGVAIVIARRRRSAKG